ncbi:hypothetical protein VB715_11225 [Crocosphaera sp. UHCC 0190]|uniref:hypothetical protein n=1 Tax=Crocosphaera sp. UHCC 0190 TaxID=3110246 RepID=UPI002B20A227|nr:hypothetical protein [Crocosphaera sp. UHCC 0190]MEA5510335.1 hypothetical protein [Crocosphaera sp. UHCC 0190]
MGSIEQPNQWVNQQLQAYQKQIKIITSQSKTIERDLNKSQKDTRNFLQQRIEEIFQKAFEVIPSFAENYWDADQNKLQKEWERKLNEIKFDQQLKNVYQQANQKFNQEVKETLEEIGQELKIIANLKGNKFQLNQQDSETFTKDLLKIGGGVLGVAGTVIALFIPPVGIIMGIGGALINLSGGWFKSRDQKRKEAVQNIRIALESQLKSQQEDMIKQSQNEFDDSCSDIVKKINNYFQSLKQALEEIDAQFQQASNNLEKPYDFLNRAYGKRIIDYCLKEYQPLTEANINTDLAKFERIFGNKIEIKTKKFFDFKISQSKLEQILQEEITITTLTGESLLM